MQKFEDVLCFGDVGAVGGDDWMEVAEDAVCVLGGQTEKTVVRVGLKENGDGDLSELHYEIMKAL